MRLSTNFHHSEIFPDYNETVDLSLAALDEDGTVLGSPGILLSRQTTSDLAFYRAAAPEQVTRYVTEIAKALGKGLGSFDPESRCN